MNIDSGENGWYADERAGQDVWTYGAEAWCNLEGQYLSIVSNLGGLATPYQMSLCSVGIMGTSYIRNESLPGNLEIAQGETMVLSVPHIYGEYTIGTAL